MEVRVVREGGEAAAEAEACEDVAHEVPHHAAIAPGRGSLLTTERGPIGLD